MPPFSPSLLFLKRLDFERLRPPSLFPPPSILPLPDLSSLPSDPPPLPLPLQREMWRWIERGKRARGFHRRRRRQTNLRNRHFRKEEEGDGGRKKCGGRQRTDEDDFDFRPCLPSTQPPSSRSSLPIFPETLLHLRRPPILPPFLFILCRLLSPVSLTLHIHRRRSLARM